VIRFLLDTNIVFEPVRPSPTAAVVDRLRHHTGEVALPSIAWQELRYGICRMDPGRKRDYLEDYLTGVVRPSMPVLPYDERAAHWHGSARATLERQGLPRPFANGQIAAIAATRDLILVTRNLTDFVPFREHAEGTLHLENWFPHDQE